MTEQETLGRILADLEWLKGQEHKASVVRDDHTDRLARLEEKQVDRNEVERNSIETAVTVALRGQVWRVLGVALGMGTLTASVVSLVIATFVTGSP